MGLFNKKNKEENSQNIWGGFVFSKNIYKRKPVRFTYREESDNPALNGWTLYSCDDDDEFVKNPDNFEIVGEDTIRQYASELLRIFDAPYGTDLCWLYKEHLGLMHFVGFYDLKADKETNIREILGK